MLIFTSFVLDFSAERLVTVWGSVEKRTNDTNGDAVHFDACCYLNNLYL